MIGRELWRGLRLGSYEPLCSFCRSQITNSNSTPTFTNKNIRYSSQRLSGIRTLFISSSRNQSAEACPEPVGIGTGKSSRLNVDIDAKATTFLTENDLKPKDHPGVFYLKKQSLPEKFVVAAERVLAHENIPSLLERSQKLQNYLWSRHLPIEEGEYREKATEAEERIIVKDQSLEPFLGEEQQLKLQMAQENKIRRRLKRLIYHWEPINYNHTIAMEYLLSRSAGEYATLMRIFTEICKRDPEFNPKTLFDFGSGIGTVVWASRTIWPKSLGEFLCADVSRDMNDLADLLLRGGSENNDHGIPGLYFRQFLPQSSRISYDLVISAYSLLELPSLKARLETLNILWKKTKNYLVIVEQGTNAGFQSIIEARDFILQLDKSEKTLDCHVFSPCPNDLACPRYTHDEIPCNFSVKYRPLYPFTQDNAKSQVFSYVVIKKGPRNSEEIWPRLVKSPMIRKKHVICRVCTKEGRLSEVLLTKHQHSQILYRVGRKSNCGDLLPVKEIDST